MKIIFVHWHAVFGGVFWSINIVKDTISFRLMKPFMVLADQGFQAAID